MMRLVNWNSYISYIWRKNYSICLREWGFYYYRCKMILVKHKNYCLSPVNGLKTWLLSTLEWYLKKL